MSTTYDQASDVGEYTTGAKWFHWISVVLIMVALPIGFVIPFITDADEGVHKTLFYAVHQTAGLTIFLVAIARLIWRIRHPAPPLPMLVPAVLRKASAAVHHSLYALMIIQPILGFLATNAWGFPMQGGTAYFGVINFPKYMETNEALAGVLQTLHTIGGFAFLVLLVLHIGGAVLHQAVRKDNTLLRMI